MQSWCIRLWKINLKLLLYSLVILQPNFQPTPLETIYQKKYHQQTSLVQYTDSYPDRPDDRAVVYAVFELDNTSWCG